MNWDEAARAFREFVLVIRALRKPGTGCPWDLEQDHRTLRPYLIEEAYEVLEAIDRGDDRALRDELGDLLLQVVLHVQVADDRSAFSITDVIRGITEKMVRRHPHVFGGVQVSGSAEVRRNWEQIKAAETQAAGTPPAGALAGVPEALPALLRAQRLGEKAARVHYDSESVPAVFTKVREGLAKLEDEARSVGDAARPLPEERRGCLEDELGDVLFNLCQLARRLGLGAEDSLRATNRRFEDRFRSSCDPG
jgi:MazG family protein